MFQALAQVTEMRKRGPRSSTAGALADKAAAATTTTKKLGDAALAPEKKPVKKRGSGNGVDIQRAGKPYPGFRPSSQQHASQNQHTAAAASGEISPEEGARLARLEACSAPTVATGSPQMVLLTPEQSKAAGSPDISVVFYKLRLVWETAPPTDSAAAKAAALKRISGGAAPWYILEMRTVNGIDAAAAPGTWQNMQSLLHPSDGWIEGPSWDSEAIGIMPLREGDYEFRVKSVSEEDGEGLWSELLTVRDRCDCCG